MREVASNLKREVTRCKGYMRWYRAFCDNNELRLFINEKQLNESKERVNIVYWNENKADLCLDAVDYAKSFYDKYKNYNIRIFIRPIAGALYSEYVVNSWNVTDRAMEIVFEE